MVLLIVLPFISFFIMASSLIFFNSMEYEHKFKSINREEIFIPSKFPQERKFTTQFEMENIEQALLTTCEMLRAYSLVNNCNKTGWSFIGKLNPVDKSLSSLSLEKRSSTLNCSNLEAYGRYVFFNAVSSFDYSKYKVRIEYPVNATDECGLSDILYK